MNKYKRKLIKFLNSLGCNDAEHIRKILHSSDENLEALGRLISVLAQKGEQNLTAEELVELFNEDNYEQKI
jgi:hypothetical protein